MNWKGAALGGAVGLALGGPLGALAGAVLGGSVVGLRGGRGTASPDPFTEAAAAGRERLEERFFETTFSVMGHLAKADGRVSETEIAFAESVMDRMALSPALRRAAILFFRQGKDPDFDLDAALNGLRAAGLGQGQLLQIFLEIQLAAAHVDGEPGERERAVLMAMRRALGVPLATFRRIEQLIRIQQRILGGFVGAGAGSAGRRRAGGDGATRQVSPLAEAYATLGIEAHASDAEVKRAYRSLMSRHHPDKLVASGVPEEALKLATQRTHEIRRAYETISRARAA